MNRSELATQIGYLANDVNHDRYPLELVYAELDNSQRKWNIGAKILKDTVSQTATSGTRQYALSNLTGTPVSFPRVTFNGIDLEKVDKSWLDLYAAGDWTENTGTPRRFLVEVTDPDVQYLTLHPTPGDADNGAPIVCEYIKDHTPMASDSDEPFNDSPLLVPYHWGLTYDVSSRLLANDADAAGLNARKAATQAKIALGVYIDVIQVFQALEKQEPLRLRSEGRLPARYK